MRADVVRDLLGDPAALPVKRYAEIVALALVFHRSWRPDDLRAALLRLRPAT